MSKEKTPRFVEFKSFGPYQLYEWSKAYTFWLSTYSGFEDRDAIAQNVELIAGHGDQAFQGKVKTAVLMAYNYFPPPAELYPEGLMDNGGGYHPPAFGVLNKDPIQGVLLGYKPLLQDGKTLAALEGESDESDDDPDAGDYVKICPDVTRMPRGDEGYMARLRRMLPESMKKVMKKRIEDEEAAFQDPKDKTTTTGAKDELPGNVRNLIPLDDAAAMARPAGPAHSEPVGGVSPTAPPADMFRDGLGRLGRLIRPAAASEGAGTPSEEGASAGRVEDAAKPSMTDVLIETMQENNRQLIHAIQMMKDRPSQGESMRRL
ncbi:MAG: hypothetical protein ACO32I_04340, partial [Candidatus Limnocylindrus sp.]